MIARPRSVILSEAWRSRSERHAQSKDPYVRYESAKLSATTPAKVC
jgi:hypothetical protein